MVNQVYTPNLFITTSKDVVDKIVGSKVQTINEAFELLTSDELLTLLVSPKSNNAGILEARQLWGASENGGDFGTFTLKVVETGESFEKFLDSISYINFIIGTNLNSLKSLKDIYNISLFNVYVSIGVGNDLKNWSTFYKYSLTDNNISYDDSGNKIVDLSFSINGSPLSRANMIAKGIESYNSSNGINHSLLNLNIKSPLVLESEKFKLERANINAPSASSDHSSLMTSPGPFINALASYISNWFGTSKENVVIAVPEDFEGFQYMTTPPGIKIIKEVKQVQTNPNIDPQLDGYSNYYVQVTTVDLENPYSDSSYKIANLPYCYYPLKNFSDQISKLYFNNLLESEYVLHIETNNEVIDLMRKYEIVSKEARDQVILFCPLFVLKYIYATRISSLLDSSKTKLDHNILIGSKFISCNQLKDYIGDYYLKFIKSNLKSSFEVLNEYADIVSINEENLLVNKLIDFDGIVFTHNTKNSNVIALDYNINTFATVYNTALKSEIQQLAVGFVNQEGILNFIGEEQKSKFNNIAYVIKKFYSYYGVSGPITSETILKDFNAIIGYNTKRIEEDLSNISQDTEFGFFEKLVIAISENLGAVGLPGGLAAGGEIKGIQALKPVNRELISKKLNTLIDDFDELSEIYGVDAFLLLLLKFINPDYNLNLPIINLIDPKDSIPTVMKYDEVIRKLSLSLTIKTLPFFNLSPHNALRRVCALYSFKNRIIGSNTKINQLNPLSNSYQIIGIDHFISNGECYSTFKLVNTTSSDSISSKPFTDLYNKNINEFNKNIKNYFTSMPLPPNMMRG